MKEKFISIKYYEYNSIEELNEKDKILLIRAIEATNGSYAPYSKFNVGAAVRLENGEIISASNQENAAYPSGLCAERTTIFYANSKFPNSAIISMAVVAKTNGELTKEPTYPCGACRQVLEESQTRGGKPIRIIIGSGEKIQIIESVKDLLPFAFNNLPE
jgi:Cytidine deaminase